MNDLFIPKSVLEWPEPHLKLNQEKGSLHGPPQFISSICLERYCETARSWARCGRPLIPAGFTEKETMNLTGRLEWAGAVFKSTLYGDHNVWYISPIISGDPTGTRMINQLPPGLCRPRWKDTANQHKRIWRTIEWTRNAWPWSWTRLTALSNISSMWLRGSRLQLISSTRISCCGCFYFDSQGPTKPIRETGDYRYLDNSIDTNARFYLQTLYRLLATKYSNLAAREWIS